MTIAWWVPCTLSLLRVLWKVERRLKIDSWLRRIYNQRESEINTPYYGRNQNDTIYPICWQVVMRSFWLNFTSFRHGCHCSASLPFFQPLKVERNAEKSLNWRKNLSFLVGGLQKFISSRYDDEKAWWRHNIMRLRRKKIFKRCCAFIEKYLWQWKPPLLKCCLLLTNDVTRAHNFSKSTSLSRGTWLPSRLW